MRFLNGWGLFFLIILYACSPVLDEEQLQHHYDQALKHYQKGDFARAIRQSEKFLAHTQDTELRADAYTIIGASYDEQQEYTKAIQYYNSALVIRQNIYGNKHARIADLYNNLGWAYHQKANYDKALDYFNKGLKIKQVTRENATPIYNNMANTYEKLGKYKLALKFHQKAFESYPEDKKHFSINNIGVLYLKQEKYELAQEYFEKALMERKKYLNKTHYLIVKTLNNLGYTASLQGKHKIAMDYYTKAQAIPHQHRKTSLESMEYKARTLKAMGKHRQALQVLQRADTTITVVRREMKLLSDQLFFSEKAGEINRLALSLCIELKDYRLAFYFSERNKANVLEASLQAKPIERIDAIRQRLRPTQALLEYTLLEEEQKLLVFAITPKAFDARVIPYDFSEDIDMFLYSTATPFEKERFLRHGYNVYRQLFQPVEKNFKGINELIIIPDGQLNYLSFEAMVRSDHGYKDPGKRLETNYFGYDYLIHRYMVSYSPSATVAFRTKKKPKYAYDYIAFAAELPQLNFARQEIQDHGRYFFHKQLYRKDWASAENFKNIRSTRILQLNTRAFYLDEVANPESFALRMSGDTLTQKDIAQTDLQIDLAILTSCTNIEGSFVEGEGVVNMAWEFVPKTNHVIYSLFNIREKFAYSLMRRFYANLKQKMSYKQALRAAKLQTLSQPETMPIEWAQVVIME